MAKTKSPNEPNEPNESASESSGDYIADKILHYLAIYPVISPTMLQAALGPGCGPRLWRPVLEGLIASGVVEQSEITAEGPTGRRNTYTQLSLAKQKKVSAG